MNYLEKDYKEIKIKIGQLRVSRNSNFIYTAFFAYLSASFIYFANMYNSSASGLYGILISLIGISDSIKIFENNSKIKKYKLQRKNLKLQIKHQKEEEKQKILNKNLK